MDVNLFAFSFKDVKEIKSVAYRSFVSFAQMVKQAKKHVASLDLTVDLDRQIRGDGLAQSFCPTTSLQEAKSRLEPIVKKAAPTIDVEVINPFIEAAKKTLEVQAKTPSHPGKPFLVKVNDKSYNSHIAIAGVINLISERFTGSITLMFSEAVFLKIYENMFGEKHEHINAEIEDAAGELLNIIYGVAKTELNKLPGMNLKPALPTVLSGSAIKIKQNTRELIVILPFETNAGAFQIEIALENV